VTVITIHDERTAGSVVACLFAVSAVKAETYSTKYDKVDVEGLLNNEDKVQAFGRCLLDDNVCSEDALLLKG
jgi:hypothetical protein